MGVDEKKGKSHGRTVVQREKKEERKKEKGKQMSLMGSLHHHYLLTQRLSTQIEQGPKNISEDPVPATAELLHELVQFVKSSVSNILCL